MSATHTSATSGSNMDVAVPRKKRNYPVLAAIGAAVGIAGAGAWYALPHGVQVAAADLRFATVSRGAFLDETAVRATVSPLHSVILDSVDAGRVEQVFVTDGTIVKKGTLLFRMSNPQRSLELLARQSDRGLNIANLSNLRVNNQNSKREHLRQVRELAFALDQSRKQHGRNIELARQGFISTATLEESADKLANAKTALEEEQSNYRLEQKIQEDSLREMERSIRSIDRGLDLVVAGLDALSVRAPVDGRLTDFRLQVGESVAIGQRLGRIDDVGRFKLSADIDEFYLNRVAVDTPGKVSVDGDIYAVIVKQLYPQIKNGRFRVDLEFERAPSKLKPGQSVDVQLVLGEPTQTLWLPSGSYLNQTGGKWVFVTDGNKWATRREISVGRRSNSQAEVTSGLKEGERVIVTDYTPFMNAERLELNN